MVDLRFLPFDFASTEITVEAASPRGRHFLAAMFGEGARSFTLPKSRGEDFYRFAEQRGMALEVGGAK